VVTPRAREVTVFTECVDADYSRETLAPQGDFRLVRCPVNERTQAAEFIDDFNESLFIQDGQNRTPTPSNVSSAPGRAGLRFTSWRERRHPTIPSCRHRVVGGEFTETRWRGIDDG
jgi:hypothetical protein